jgi:thiol-disulfide isomerase/thioredoxin
MNKIDAGLLKLAMTYSDYIAKMQSLLEQGKSSTTDNGDKPNLMPYTQLNMQRMNRLDKTTQLLKQVEEDLKNIKKPMTWLVITEGWCGDAAQIIPVFEKMAEVNPHITHLMVFRDEHPALMEAFLTDTSRSIPKLIALDTDNRVLGTWGPRPKVLQDIVMDIKVKMLALPKEERKAFYEASKADVQRWYNNDKTQSIQRELVEELNAWID